ncbi:MAG: radical SAM protein [Thermodesulfobacteriota bacterium]
MAQQVDLKELKEFSNLELPRERSFSWAGLRVTLWKRGQLSRQKLSFPQHYGIYHELETREHIFKYNLRGQICYIQGKSMDWPHPGEWLKRTQGGDWIYYYSGGYTDLRDYLGEFYLPCPDYPSNILYNVEPWQEPAVQKALQEWKRVPDGLNPELGQLDDPELLQLYGLLRENTAARLWQDSLRLFSLLGDRIKVLPPDARHTDYDLLPLILADGCLYNCSFCSFKTGQSFQPRPQEDIQAQIQGLRSFFAQDLINQNALFLGQHDALNCEPGHLLQALDLAWEQLGLQDSVLQGNSLYLFGSVDSLLDTSQELFQELAARPWSCYINIGLESADQQTLDLLGKPVQASQVRRAFRRMQDLNQRFSNLELTGNFILDKDLPQGHWEAVLDLLQAQAKPLGDKGSIYFSPLGRQNIRWQRDAFRRIKFRSRLPVYLYVILRL